MSTLLLNKKFHCHMLLPFYKHPPVAQAKDYLGVDVASTSYSYKTCSTTSSASQSTKPSAKVYACSGLGPIAKSHKTNDHPNFLNPRADDAKY